MRVITVFNHKGGCGKTTTAINLSAALASARKRVLLVDLDPQAHSTLGCGVREDEVELGTWDVLSNAPAGPLGLPDVAWEITDGLYLAPATTGLAVLEQTLAGTDGRDRRLADRLDRLGDKYDFVVVDCGPGLGLLAVNALVAATEVVVPVDLGFFSVHGLKRTLEAVAMVADRTGREPAVHVLATMYDTRARTMRQTLGSLRDQYGARLLTTVIHFSVDLREAAARGSPIAEFKPQSRGYADYRAMAEELMASGLQIEYETLVREEAEAIVREEKAVDEKIEAVYGAIVTDGGVRFVCHAPEAKRVQVAGDFNRWSTENGESEFEATRQSGVWRKEVPLKPGRYAYRLVIDGRWTSDPANPYVESNPYGELNSVVEIK